MRQERGVSVLYAYKNHDAREDLGARFARGLDGFWRWRRRFERGAVIEVFRLPLQNICNRQDTLQTRAAKETSLAMQSYPNSEQRALLGRQAHSSAAYRMVVHDLCQRLGRDRAVAAGVVMKEAGSAVGKQPTLLGCFLLL